MTRSLLYCSSGWCGSFHSRLLIPTVVFWLQRCASFFSSFELNNLDLSTPCVFSGSRFTAVQKGKRKGFKLVTFTPLILGVLPFSQAAQLKTALPLPPTHPPSVSGSSGYRVPLWGMRGWRPGCHAAALAASICPTVAHNPACRGGAVGHSACVDVEV